GIDINLHIAALLPEDYVPDVHLRLILYKRVSSTKTAAELRDLQVELIDRFGLLPQPAKNLLRIAAIKQSAVQLGIEKIDVADQGGYLKFAQQSHIDPVALVHLVQNDSQTYKLRGSHRLQFRGDLGEIEDRFTTVEKLLDRLAVKEPEAMTG
ncbi:MAG: transcription-repair coupling factor, partial [Gammaproteobacteria bacterium]|nr:transcription-repair coupling factor [Gammaproteobacteria bacterium]